MRPGKLIAHSGAEFKWDEKSFDFNQEAMNVLIDLENFHNSKVTYSDYGSGEYYQDGRSKAWGKRNDYSYFNEAVLFNIGQFIKEFPETQEQFIDYLATLDRSFYD